MDIDSYRCQKLWCWNFKRQWCAVAVPYSFYTINIYIIEKKSKWVIITIAAAAIVALCNSHKACCQLNHKKVDEKFHCLGFDRIVYRIHERLCPVSTPLTHLAHFVSFDNRPIRIRSIYQLNIIFFHFLFSVMESYYRKWQFMFRLLEQLLIS